MSVCGVCGSTDFGDPHDGLFFCLECGTQSQDAREEVSQLEEGGGDRYIRRLKAKKGKPKSDDVREETGPKCVFESLQQIIQRQCDALISLGFDPSLKAAARLIWFTYLRHYGYAFRDQTQSVSGRPQARGSQSLLSSQASPTVSNKCRGKRKRLAESENPELSLPIKKEKELLSEETAGYDAFPDDAFLFETPAECTESSRDSVEAQSKTMGGSKAVPECVKVVQSLKSWEELDALERSMDASQLLAFRKAYRYSEGLKPQFVADDEPWACQPRVFTIYMTVSLLYLALMYTEQPLLPVDLVRWVRSERIPLNTPLADVGPNSASSQLIFRTNKVLSTSFVVENAMRLHLHLPLPPLPRPDPLAISHILIDRLQLTECFKRLVDRALTVVYRPVGFTRARMDVECVAVIIVMLKILYGLNDHTELLDKLPADPTDPGGGSEEGLTPANSLPLWVDWVQLYCSQAPSTPADEYSPFTLLELSKIGNQETYFQFCRNTIFTKCRPTPTQNKSFQYPNPAFSKKVSNIFASVMKTKPRPAPPSSDESSSSFSSTPDPSATAAKRSQLQLVHISRFVDNSKAPCAMYRPLPTSYHCLDEWDGSHLSHAMQFLLSACCRLVDVPEQSLFTTILAVEKVFTKGTLARLNNLVHDFALK